MRQAPLGLACVLALIVATPTTAGAQTDARRCTDSSRPRAAIAACTRQIRSGRFHGRFLAYKYSARAAMWVNLRRYTQALADMNKAIQVYAYPRAYARRGAIYAIIKQYNRALADLNEAIRLSPNFGFAYANRGAVYARLKQYRRALKDMNRAIGLGKEITAVWYRNRGIVHDNLRNRRAAIRDLLQAARLGDRVAVRKLGKMGIKAPAPTDQAVSIAGHWRYIHKCGNGTWHGEYAIRQNSPNQFVGHFQETNSGVSGPLGTVRVSGEHVSYSLRFKDWFGVSQFYQCSTRLNTAKRMVGICQTWWNRCAVTANKR